MAARKPVIVPPRRPPSLAIPPTPDEIAKMEAFERGVSQVSARHPPDTSQTPAKPRREAGSAVLFERKRGPARRRMNVYFTPDVHRRLAEYCQRTGDEMSRFIDAAVEHALDVKAERE